VKYQGPNLNLPFLFLSKNQRGFKVYSKHHMPKISEKQRTLAEIEKLLFYIMLFSDTDENEVKRDIQELIELEVLLRGVRYVSERGSIPKQIEARGT
jgi:hypothetical protein